jgi:hypothetical protein
MSYGFRVKKANGAVRIDSGSFGALYAEALNVPPKVGMFTKSYPNFKGMTLKGLGHATKYVSYPGGIPTVTVDTSWALKPVTLFLFIV